MLSIFEAVTCDLRRSLRIGRSGRTVPAASDASGHKPFCEKWLHTSTQAKSVLSTAWVWIARLQKTSLTTAPRDHWQFPRPRTREVPARPPVAGQKEYRRFRPCEYSEFGKDAAFGIVSWRCRVSVGWHRQILSQPRVRIPFGGGNVRWIHLVYSRSRSHPFRWAWSMVRPCHRRCCSGRHEAGRVRPSTLIFFRSAAISLTSCGCSLATLRFSPKS